MRFLIAFAFMVFSSLVPAVGQDESPWQAAITGQVEALRAHDGALALTFAGAAFRSQFEGKPEVFDEAIAASGYGPIAESRTHSFGAINRIDDVTVTQVVMFIGKDQKLYEAIYQLNDEEGEGWRVSAVALRQETGIGI